MPNKTVRRSLSMTPEMAERLRQIARSQPRSISEADLIREAIRRYLDDQEDLIGSRKHFQRAFRQRIDEMESALAFQLTVLTYLLSTDEALLRYLQYRDKVQNELAQVRDYERWQDRGMGLHWRDIFSLSHDLQSKHVLAWTWVVSPAPDLMALVPENKRRDFVCDLTERVVEDYYLQRGFDLPEYSYILHDRATDDGLQQLHTHIALPGTAPSIAERLPVYNNKTRGDDALFRQVALQHFANMLDDVVGPEWRRLREPEQEVNADLNDLDAWFPQER